jgi:DNA/RNA-binding domain of Phe-tRNA-synthetase-like protein
MIYRIAPILFARYPGYVRGVVVAKRSVNVEGPIDEVAHMLKSAETAIRERSDLDPISAHLNIAAWREAYRAFGAKPTEFPSSIEAMVKRVRRGDASTSLSTGLPYINTLAAICNSVSLRYLTPIGGHALDEMQANHEMKLGFARGDEEFIAFGTTAIEHPIAGEVIYTYNVSTVLCRRWTWRQAEFSKLQRTTSYAAINVDGLPPVTREDVELISADLARLVSMYCGATTEVKMLSEEMPGIEV